MDSNRDIGERLLDAWLTLSSTIWNERYMKNLTFNEAYICNLLHRQDLENPSSPLTATILCQRTRLLKSQMNKLLSEMERKGYITRARSERDHRQILIRISDEGLRVYQKEHANISAIVEQIIRHIGEEQANITVETIGEICTAIEKIGRTPPHT